MRLQVAKCHWLLLLLINLSNRGRAAEQKKHDFRKTSTSSNSLMETMMKKYSYPKNEVTAGVGYGHHLHPYYYRGEREMMYPCAVECGEWETMDMDDSANDASSNVDVVTVRPDVSSIDITTSKPRPYKDAALLRPKKYQSAASTPKSTRQKDYAYEDSKSSDLQIVPRTAENQGYVGERGSKDMRNDGSLYARYRDALVDGYEGELMENTAENKENEYFDPVQESLRYNPPSFNDADNDDIEAPVYPTKGKLHPKRERIEEKYVKHNVREERLEDVRTNSFGTSGEGIDYPTDSGTAQPPNSYAPVKYIDDYAAPKPYHSYPPNQGYQDQYRDEKPFSPSPPQGHVLQEAEKYQPVHAGYLGGHAAKLPKTYKPQNPISDQDPDGYSDYGAQEYGSEQDMDYDEPPEKLEGYFGATKGYNDPPQANYIQQGRNYPRYPTLRNRPSLYGRNRKHPLVVGSGRNPPRSQRFQSGGLNYQQTASQRPYRGSYFHQRSPYADNAGHPYYHYAPRHGYPPQGPAFPGRLSSGGIRVVQPPRRPHPPRHGKFPYRKKGPNTSPLRGSSYVRGQKISYRRTIPQKDGFTKIVKKYRTFVDHTPKRYVGSGEPYVSP